MLNNITGIPVLYTILKKNHNTGTYFYTSIVHNTSIPVLWSPSTGDPYFQIGYWAILHMVRNGYGAKYIWYEMVSGYGTKLQFCGTKW